MTLSLKHKKKNKSICAFCGYSITKRALHIHHIDGNHNNNEEKNLVVVCANCHAEAHEKQKMRNPNMIIEPIMAALKETKQTPKNNKKQTNKKHANNPNKQQTKYTQTCKSKQKKNAARAKNNLQVYRKTSGFFCF